MCCCILVITVDRALVSLKHINHLSIRASTAVPQCPKGLRNITLTGVISWRVAISVVTRSCPKLCPPLVESKTFVGILSTVMRLRVGEPNNIVQEVKKSSILKYN